VSLADRRISPHRAERGSGRAQRCVCGGEESEVADANQAAGQDVKQETAQNSSAEMVMTFFLPPWDNLSSGRTRDHFQRHETMVGDGNAMV